MLMVRDIMITDVYTVTKDATVRSVLEAFVRYRISGMPVVDASHRLVGYISDGDIMRYLGRHVDYGASSWTTMIGEYYGLTYDYADEQPANLMDELKENVFLVSRKNVLDVGTRRVISVREEDSVVSIAQLLSHKKIKKVPVVRDTKLVGIISRGDVVRAVVQRFFRLPPDVSK